MADWFADMVDINGLPLTSGGAIGLQSLRLTQQRSAPSIATATVNANAEYANALMSETVQPYLKLYRQTTSSTATRSLKFYGSVEVDELRGDAAGSTIAITAFDPLIILAARVASLNYTSQDIGALIRALVDATNTTDGETGIETSASYITASVNSSLDARQDQPDILSVIGQYAAQLDGVETWIEPIEYAAGKIGRLYVAPNRGSASGVVFGYGPGTNCAADEMTRSRDKTRMVNDATGYSETLTSNKTDATGVAAFRRRMLRVSYTGETSATRLAARTQYLIDTQSQLADLAEYTAKPALGGPAYFDDFTVGDTVTLDYRDGEISWTAEQRVQSATIEVDAGGNEQVSDIEFGAP